MTFCTITSNQNTAFVDHTLREEREVMSPPDEIPLAIDRFVSNLWSHVWIRSLGADKETLITSTKRVKQSLEGIDPHKCFEEIGESLAAHILTTTVESFSRPNCQMCKSFSNCYAGELDPCAKYVKSDSCYLTKISLTTESVLLLDGVFGINAPEILSVIHRYIDATNSL